MIEELKEVINSKLHELITMEKIDDELYRSYCLKDKTHFMYISGHTLSCPICGFSGDLTSISAEIVGVSEMKMAKRIFKNKFGKNIEKEEMFDHEILKDANYNAMLFYQENLKKSPAALKYLKDRGISKESIETFKIGYAPGYNRLLKTMVKDFGLKVLKEVGLIDISQKNKRYYDVFRERIIFPIMDEYGKDVLGFGGRTISDNNVKYINTKTTPIFEKSKELFGFDKTKPSDSILIAEGYLDVIIMYQNNIRNAVGTLGTALSDHHYRKLNKIYNEIIMIYDGDEPGIKAAERAIEKIGDVELLILPEKMDPDDFIRKNGVHSFLLYIEDNKTDAISYWVDKYTPDNGNIFEYLEKHIKPL